MSLFGASLAGPGYIILNIIRVLNIMSLLAIMAACCVMLIKTFIVSKFFFFDAASHVITVSISMFLVISELPLFRSYITRNWPLLSPAHGFVTLGAAMMALGVSLLGGLNVPSKSQESLGLAFWRIVLGAGIVAIILGFLNILCSFIFRDKATYLTARHVRSYGAVAAHKQPSCCSVHTSPSSNIRRSFHLTRQFDLLPSYHSSSPKKSVRSKTRRISDCYSTNHRPTNTSNDGSPHHATQPIAIRMPLNISAPLNLNPQFADYAKMGNANGGAGADSKGDVMRPTEAVVRPHHGTVHPALCNGNA
ncbi:MAG: hypothetical protein M1819_006002 [Sarea resinae]|nr:MAG: hypothetical protein M1819_006002 [Sarea resinae]